MTPPAATAAARSAPRRPAAQTRPAPKRPPSPRRTAPARPRRSPAPRVARRVSGPARPRAAARPGLAVAGAPLALRLVGFTATLPDRRLVERLTRGRGWIALIGALLIGLVAMQVSLLKLNAGIGTAVQRASDLERRNGELRAEVSRLSAGERIQDKAIELGMVMPPAGGIRYLDAVPARDAQAAAQALREQRFADPSAAVPALGAVAPEAAAGGPDGGATGEATTATGEATAVTHEHAPATPEQSTAESAPASVEGETP